MAQSPSLIGRYQILGVVGRGGMGAVYRAFDPGIKRHVAIKAINKSMLDEAELAHVMARFRHEAQAVGRLTHPRIVAIYDYGEDGDHAYIVMELVQGRSLYDHLAQPAAYDVRESGEIIAQLLEALGYCHAEGVIHRDIKPSNILVNSDGRIKLSDFGIAHIESSELTKLGEVLGTPYYMAPEQFMGTEVDHLADLYAVGVIAYELLTGQKPFTGNTANVMRQALNERPRNPSEVKPELGTGFDAVLQKALAKKREERYGSAREFAEAFAAAVAATLARPTAPAAAAATGPGIARAARLIHAAPQAPVAPEPPPPTLYPAPSRSGRKARLLFVDDEERIVNALKSVFRHGYHVFATTSGQQALDFLKKFPVEVVVSDQRMPEMTGVEMLRQAKELAPQTVRILLTGYSDLAAIVGSINDGEVFRFISKPWDNAEIQRTIAEAASIAFALAEMPPRRDEAAAPVDEALLVVDGNDNVFRAVREVYAGTCKVLYAATLEDALALMKSNRVAVILADIGAGHADTTTMYKLLKQEHPEILTIVMTTASDSEEVIELINQAQIFRFLNKPVNLKILQGHVQAALARYQAFKAQPALAEQQKVAVPERLAASPEAQSLLERIRALGGRWLGSNEKS